MIRLPSQVVYGTEVSELADWLKTSLTALPKVGKTEMAANARKTSSSAYSTSP
jgi:hypothetical protein